MANSIYKPTTIYEAKLTYPTFFSVPNKKGGYRKWVEVHHDGKPIESLFIRYHKAQADSDETSKVCITEDPGDDTKVDFFFPSVEVAIEKLGHTYVKSR